MNLLGGDTLLWHGGLNLGRPRTRPRNLPPVAGDDTILAVAGGTATIPVLANDADPEGEPLRVVEATAQNGTVTIEADGTLTYTAPSDFSGTDTITYKIADPHNATDTGIVTVDVVILSVVQGDTEEEFVVSAASGELMLRISEPSAYQGDYPIDTGHLEGGPLNLVLPRLAGAAEIGETLSASGGLWAFDEANGPLTVARQWLRDDQPISGATTPTYIVTQEDAGRELALREQGSTLAGSRSVTSAPVTVGKRALWSPASLPSLALWLDASDASTITASAGTVTQWKDKSGNGRHAIPASATGPVTGAINGLTAVDVGTDQALKFPAPGIAGAADRSVLMAVGPFTGNTSLRSIFTLGGGDNTGTGRRWCVRADGGKVRVEINSGFHVSQLDAMAGGVLGAYHTGATFAGLALSRDGTHQSSLTSSTTAIATLDQDGLIGFKASNLSGNAAGPVGEVILCAALLSQSDRQKAEGYLAHKWGFAGLLPASHPFKASPPLA